MSERRTVAEILSEAEPQLLSGNLGLTRREARLEARVLACHALNVETVWLLAHDTDPLTELQFVAFDSLLARRLTGEPVAYILGEREFYSRPFRVTPTTLIPRPETELLIEAALTRGTVNARVLDIGTGSGCIAITLKLERPDWQITAIDLSIEALRIARENGERLNAHVEWLESDLFTALPDQTFDLIVSNPPYVAKTDPHLGQGDVRFEPGTALVSGPDGLDAIRKIIKQAPTYISAGGWLLLEHGWNQGETVDRLFAKAGFEELFLQRDLAARPRISGGRKRPS